MAEQNPSHPTQDGDAAGAEHAALLAAVQAVLTPLAQLALVRGLPFGTVEELLKQAYVDAADRAHADLLPHRRVSRVSTATGIHRREVTRLIQELRDGRLGQPRERRSIPNELVMHWLTHPRFRDREGQPLSLPRHAAQARQPSFEELAHSVTRDVHPRSLLDELLRLNMARLDADDCVHLQRDAILPRGDSARMLKVLGKNVGAHLAAAVDNVQSDQPQHLERALFAQGLSERSVQELRTLVSVQWQALSQALVPALEAMVERDAQPTQADEPLFHVRLGLYNHASAQAAEPPAPMPVQTSGPASPEGKRRRTTATAAAAPAGRQRIRSKKS